MTDESWGLHWFRRDLRIRGNQAFLETCQDMKGRVLGFFCFDPVFLSRSDFSHNRFAFFLKTLMALKDELRERGSDLLVLDHGPLNAFEELFHHFRTQKVAFPQRISFNRDYEPFARERDTKLQDFFSKKGIEFKTFRDHLLIEPGEILKSGGKSDYYSVYSPFAKKWFLKLGTDEIQSRIQRKPLKARCSLTWSQLFSKKRVPEDHLLAYWERLKKKVTVPLPPAGNAAASRVLDQFKQRLDDYIEQRDFPSINGTSHLSIYLKNGSITSSEIISTLDLSKQNFSRPSGRTQYLKELAWREFYYQVLWFRPDVEKEPFRVQYSNLEWKNNEGLFAAWAEGQTGYPIVDAGMRQLATTGWMHNRVRMIVASFLTKDLLIDYRWGERLFMERLLDGDLAPNNGGWQWAASTGCDPQPYFRIFNPELQSRKFDPKGEYIKTYCPELKELTAKDIHRPPVDKRRKYVAPIVNHATQKTQALELFRKKGS